MKTISFETYGKLTELELKADAYTLDEILDMLPSSIVINQQRFDLIIEKLTEKTTNQHWYAFSYNGSSDAATVYKTATEAAGQMLIWCIKNGHVKVEDLNNENNQC